LKERGGGLIGGSENRIITSSSKGDCEASAREFVGGPRPRHGVGKGRETLRERSQGHEGVLCFVARDEHDGKSVGDVNQKEEKKETGEGGQQDPKIGRERGVKKSNR